MEIILPSKKKKTIHPTVIFKEAWGICWKHLGKLSVIYLIFNLPVAVAYLTPMAKMGKEPNPSMFLWFFLPVLIISIWGHIALLLSAKKAVDSEDYTIGQSISQTKGFFLKYLGTVLVSALFLMGIPILGSISVAVILALLLKGNKILAVLVCLALAIAAFASFVYFMLRWSFAPTVCVLENTRPITALKRSFSLVKDYIHPVVGTYCLVTLIYIACLLPIIIAGGFLATGNNAEQFNRVYIIYSIFINIALVPFCVTITVVLYKKLKEALKANVYA